MDTLDWTLLRSFLAVIEAGSLSGAAARIGATHPTLSRHIRELEAILGITLFTRSMRGVDPTEAALALVEDARAMGRAAQSLSLKAQGRSVQLTGTVRITASVVVANLLMPPIIAALRESEPSIQIEIAVSDVTQDLLRRDADIAIRMHEPTQNALIARKLGVTPIQLFATRSYFERRGPLQTLEDLHKHDIIGFDRSDAFIKFFAAMGHTTARDSFPIRCDDHMVQWNLLLAGAGVGFVQSLIAARVPELTRAGLEINAELPVWLVMHEDVRTNARIRRVADFVGSGLQAMLPSK